VAALAQQQEDCAKSIPEPQEVVKSDTIPQPDPIGTWMKEHQISIRKTFDGTKEEQNPASLFWVHEPTGSDTNYSLIDVGVKVSEWEPSLGKCSTQQLIFYPVVEYHKSSAETKRQGKLSFAAKAEYRPKGLKLSGVNDTTPDTWPIAPTFLFETKLAYDFVLKQVEQKLGLAVAPTSNLAWLPGSDWRSSSGAFLGRYYTYLGIEHFRYGTSGADTTVTDVLLRLAVEAWPFAGLDVRHFQLTFDAAYRHLFSDELLDDRNVTDLTFGANFYVDGFEHVGIGFDYARGRDASKRFVERRRTSIGLKVKF
jgi:hypothetical protein